MDDDDPWTTESDDSWYPAQQDAPAIEVDWEPPEPAGHLWYPDGSYSVVEQDKAPFGFGRWLYEQGEQMGFADEVEAVAQVKGPTCAVRSALDALDAKLVAEVEDVIFNRMDLPATAIAKKLTERAKVKVGADTLRRHRKHECACAKAA